MSTQTCHPNLIVWVSLPGRPTIRAVPHIGSLLRPLLLDHQLLLHRIPVKRLHCHRHDHWLVFLHVEASIHSCHCFILNSMSSGSQVLRLLLLCQSWCVCAARPPLARHPGVAVAGGSAAGANSSSLMFAAVFAANF